MCPDMEYIVVVGPWFHPSDPIYPDIYIENIKILNTVCVFIDAKQMIKS